MKIFEEMPNKQRDDALKAYPKPEGYSELNFEGLKFYYSSEEMDYSAFDKQNFHRFDKYDFVYERDITDSVMAFKNKEGRTALVLHTSVPTFDDADYEWNSYRKLYLLPETGRITAFLCCGGYKLAKVFAYEDVWWADEKTEKLLKSTDLFDCVYRCP